ncbi:hypothetical protein WICPIJ_003473 [Wickerhamomyces pijperi]|uniref:Uncharacterized protein n=1 Tax=Wickerhamomyces pijperi TaxID=599730 RepID=A0A9P8Q720_WICPI|nr:hypothetical protein WICPIJ_003473 [Wickerhamomyces pijperi]
MYPSVGTSSASAGGSYMGSCPWSAYSSRAVSCSSRGSSYSSVSNSESDSSRSSNKDEYSGWGNSGLILHFVSTPGLRDKLKRSISRHACRCKTRTKLRPETKIQEFNIRTWL